MFRRRYDVFLSYSRADTDRVSALRDELRRMGYRVFFDAESIDPGQKWKPRLERSIRASRTMVLCWSEKTRASDYITFEYSRAEALGRPIFPWLLDSTPLPAMLEIQGIPHAAAGEVAQALRQSLGRTLAARHRMQAALALLLVVALACVAWRALRPPPPAPDWTMSGEIIDRETRLPIAGVEVDAKTGRNPPATALTDSSGRYDLHLTPPQPKNVLLQFRKAGYEGDQAMVSTRKAFNTDLVKLH